MQERELVSAFLVAGVGVKREHVQMPGCRSSRLQEGSGFPMCSCLLAIACRVFRGEECYRV